MKIKWKSLFDDLKTVFKKHFSEPEKAPMQDSTVALMQMIHSLQKQQASLNNIRDDVAKTAALIKNDEIFREMDRLAAMAPKEEAFDKKDFDGYDDDFMFI